MYPPDTYPKDIYPPDTYPLDTYPPDTYPLGQIPPGQIPPEQIRLAQIFETERKKESAICFVVIDLFQIKPFPLFLPWPYDNYQN